MPNVTYVRRRSNGLCGACEQPALPGRSRCQTHLEAARHGRRTLYYAYKARGLCVICGELPEKRKQTCCKRCKVSIESCRAVREQK